MSEPYPLRFIPHYEQRLWGGEKFKTHLNKDIQGNQYGESWEISVLKGKASVVQNGTLKGTSLPQLIAENPKEILGLSVLEKCGPEFPLLIKFIDAKLPLSVQVHPDDQLAKERHRSTGKTEMWYIMDADPGSELVLGFKESIKASEYKSLLNSVEIEKSLHKEKVKVGDVIHVPAGLVHGIGKGILLAEIQQSSDITYRVYDYDRVDKATGVPRVLHKELAESALDVTLQNEAKVSYTNKVNQANLLVDSPYFMTSLFEMDGGKVVESKTQNSFIVLIGIEGNCVLIHENISYSLAKGTTLLLPANLGHYQLKGKGKLLEVQL